MQPTVSTTTPDDPSIRLDGSAVVQLLLFASDRCVRDAAARLLERYIRIDDGELCCHDRDLGTLPYVERISALLCASLYQNAMGFPRQCGAMPHSSLERAPPCPDDDPSGRIFHLHGGRVRGWKSGGRTGPFTYRRRSTFSLPTRPQQLTPHVRASLGMRGRVVLDGSVAPCISFAISRTFGRITAGWDVPCLIAPDGSVAYELPSLSRNPFAASIRLDPAMLLRLAAGNLAGCLLAFTRPRCAMRPSTVEVSVELGAGETDTPILVGFRGNRHSGMNFARDLGIASCDFPLLDGATLRSLDAIARQAGVVHGGRMRGSFAHHPFSTHTSRKEYRHGSLATRSPAP